ncbi:hypothetical protein WG66_009834 [Moniliophthora roreri]|nr:hypothetical protein WG66_009834 [Moniliophthora roreri]
MFLFPSTASIPAVNRRAHDTMAVPSITSGDCVCAMDFEAIPAKLGHQDTSVQLYSTPQTILGELRYRLQKDRVSVGLRKVLKKDLPWSLDLVAMWTRAARERFWMLWRTGLKGKSYKLGVPNELLQLSITK